MNHLPLDLASPSQHQKYEIFMWDINSAYLHGKIDHNIYVTFPNGYETPGKVVKLNKALYGLPEAA